MPGSTIAPTHLGARTLGEEMSREELRSLLFLADMDEDGHVDYQEFVRMIFDRK